MSKYAMPILQLPGQPDTCIAVAGATDNPGKFGHAIYRDLKRKGYQVYPIKPHSTYFPNSAWPAAHPPHSP